MLRYVDDDLQHQAEDLVANGQRLFWGRLWEMGVGKTRPTLQEAAILYREGKIDALVIVAPKAVALNWIHDQIPQHLPRDINARCHAYEMPKAKQAGHHAACAALVEQRRRRGGLVVLSISYEGIMSEEGCDLAAKLMADALPDGGFRSTGRAMLVADESSYLGNVDAQRTKRMFSLGGLAKYRRILEGTPVTNNPRNVYSQMKFLDEGYWSWAGRQILGYPLGSFTEFVSTFCIVKKGGNTGRMGRTVGKGASKKFIPAAQVVGYQRLDDLHKMLMLGASRLTTEQAGIWLPEKTYQRLKFELHPKQRKPYDELKREYMTDVQGHLVTATLAMVRLLRLQQITSGYLPTFDERGEAIMVPLVTAAENPRLELAVEHLNLVPHQTIVFARFTPEVDMLMDALGKQAVRYDGQTSDRDRERSLAAFHGGDAKLLVGKVGAAGRGLTLTEAKRTVYYSNDFDYGMRKQSEKRAHRIGQKDPCFYDDLQARRTVDGQIIESHLSKDEIAAQVTGDRLMEWLTDNSEAA